MPSVTPEEPEPFVREALATAKRAPDDKGLRRLAEATQRVNLDERMR